MESEVPLTAFTNALRKYPSPNTKANKNVLFMHTMSCISQKFDKPTEMFIAGGKALIEVPHSFPFGKPTCLGEDRHYRKREDVKILWWLGDQYGLVGSTF